MESNVTTRHLRRAYNEAAFFSNDPKTRLGAVLCDEAGTPIGFGANFFPQGVKVTPERLERPKKYSFMEHAERNAIYAACREGRSTKGGTLYCPWFACADCARAIIQAGIKRVVGHKQHFDKAGEYHWNDSIALGNEMFADAGIETELYDGEIGNVQALFNGETWNP